MDNALGEGRNYQIVINEEEEWELYLTIGGNAWTYGGTYTEGLEAHAVGQQHINGRYASKAIESAAYAQTIFSRDELEAYGDYMRQLRAAANPTDPRCAAR